MTGRTPDFSAWAEFRHRIGKILGREARFAREAGLSPQQHEVLVSLCGRRRQAAPTAAELAERVQLPRATVTRILGALERRGLVTRRGAHAGPETTLTPTPEARRLVKCAAFRHESALQEDGLRLLECLSALVPEEVQAPAGRARAASRRIVPARAGHHRGAAS